MTLDDILEEYTVDSKIESLDLESSLKAIPLLHGKYLNYLRSSNKTLRKLEANYKKLYQLKSEYFGGFLNGTDELKKLEWPPYTRTILKGDIPRFVESDGQIIRLTENIGEAKEMNTILNSILKEIMQRSFIIKDMIAWRKFTEGVM